MRDLSLNEMEKTTGGEAITLASIMALMAVVCIEPVVCYRLFKSGSGKVSLPGPFSFTWG